MQLCVSRDCFLVVFNRCQQTTEVSSIDHFFGGHCFLDVCLVNTSEEFGELADGFVENWQELVSLQPKLPLQLVDGLELEPHTDEQRYLDIRQGDRALWEDREEQLRNGWHEVHDQVEVH